MSREAYRFCDKHEWFDWPQYGLAIGSDRRYKPRWWERRAYFCGLRDAARIAEHIRFDRKEGPESDPYRATDRTARRIVRLIHAHMLEWLGFPPDDKSGLEDL